MFLSYPTLPVRFGTHRSPFRYFRKSVSVRSDPFRSVPARFGPFRSVSVSRDTQHSGIHTETKPYSIDCIDKIRLFYHEVSHRWL